MKTIDIRGSINERDDTAPGGWRRVVYQGCAPGLGNISNGGKFDRQRRAWVPTPNANTPAQRATRATLAAGVAAWKALSPEQREPWKTLGAPLSLPAYQAFMRHWLLSPSLPVVTWDAWDAGASTWQGDVWDAWDAGESTWIS